MTPLFLPLFLDISGGEFIVLFIAVFVIFGPKKMPEIARTIGKGMNELKKATSDLSKEFKEGMNTVKDQATIIPPDVYGNRPYQAGQKTAETNTASQESRPFDAEVSSENRANNDQSTQNTEQTRQINTKSRPETRADGTDNGLLF